MSTVEGSNLKRSILIPVLLVAGFMLAAFVFSLNQTLRLIAEQEFAREGESLQSLWEVSEAEAVKRLNLALSFLAADGRVRAALRDRDRAYLMRRGTPLFKRFQQTFGIDRLTFFDAKRHAIFRSSRPQEFGFVRDDPLFLQAELNRQPTSGFALDREGNVVLRTIQPAFEDARLVGFIVAAELAQDLLAQMTLFDAGHALVVARGGANAHRFNTVYRNAGVLPGFDERLREGRFADLVAGTLTSHDGRNYYLSALPLAASSGTSLGYVVSSIDVTGPHHAIRTSSLELMLLASGATLVALAFLYRVTARTQRALEQSQAHLTESTQRIAQADREWRDSIDAIREPIFLHDEGFRVIRANKAYVERTGLPLKAVLGRPYWELFPRHHGPLESCRKVLARESGHEETLRLGDEVFFSRAFPMYDEKGRYRYSVHILEDVTQRERILQKLKREVRARRTVSHSNEALIRATSEQQLLRDICQIITSIGGYKLAWVGFKEMGLDKRIAPMAASGASTSDIEALQPTWGETPGCTSPCLPLNQGEMKVIHDLHTADERARVWAQAFGCASLLAFPLQRADEIFGVLVICSVDDGAFNTDEQRLLHELANDLAFGITALRSRADRDQAESARLEATRKLETSLEKTVQAMATALEARDPYTAGHQRRVAELAVAIARELELSAEVTESLRIAAVVHDVGKIYVPAEILSKPRLLSRAEHELVKSHCEVGFDILKDIDFPWPVAEMVLQHHERMDGSGYPRGLSGDQILPQARILAVADVVEAMASHRPYRPARPMSEALGEIAAKRGTHYDPAVVDACMVLFRHKGFQLPDSAVDPLPDPGDLHRE